MLVIHIVYCSHNKYNEQETCDFHWLFYCGLAETWISLSCHRAHVVRNLVDVALVPRRFGSVPCAEVSQRALLSVVFMQLAETCLPLIDPVGSIGFWSGPIWVVTLTECPLT